jgi:hypothetical protein
MPWTTYRRLGFEPVSGELRNEEDAPHWVRGEVHEPIASEFREAREAGRSVVDLLSRAMVLRIKT